MLKYVADQSDSGMPMAVMTLTDRLHVLQEFTSDPKVLARAIKNLRPQEQILQAEGIPSPPSGSADAIGSGPGTTAAIEIAQAQVAAFESVVTGYNLELRTVLTIQAMTDLSRL